MKSFILASLLVLTASILVAEQPPVLVVDMTIKIPGLTSEVVYYSFAEGDLITFFLEEVKGKPLKRVEVSEGGDHTLYKDFQVRRISEKIIRVHKTAVYEFRFENEALLGRVCRIRIERTPMDESSRYFDTGWEWETVFDTTYLPYTQDSLVGHDTTYATKQIKVLVSDELVLQELLTNHGIEVHSQTYQWLTYPEGALNEEILQVDLPNQILEAHKQEETVAWFYGIGVNQKLKLQIQNNRSDLLRAGGNMASMLAGPEMKIVFTALDYATRDNSDQSVYCALLPDRWAANNLKDDLPFRRYREDQIVSSEAIRVDSPLYGQPFFGFINSNYRDGITVYVNVAVWRRIRVYEDQETIEEIISPRYVKLNKNRMSIRSSKVRVPLDK